MILMTDRILKYTLITLAALNMADYFFTLRAVYSMGIQEANPAMDAALGGGPSLLFTLIKLVAIPLICLIIWRSRSRWHRMKPLICNLLIFVTVAYVAVTAWHIYGQFILS